MPISQIVAADATGSPYNTVPPNVAGSGAGGNGGAAARSGQVSVLLDNVAVSRPVVDAFGSTVVDTDDIDSAGGTLAYDNQRPIAKRVTTEINGSSNTVLQSGAARPDLIRSIHKLEVLRTRRLTTAIRNGEWNIYSGAWSTNPVVAVDVLDTDNAATPTRDIPGQLVYKTGSYQPVTDEYKAKNG